MPDLHDAGVGPQAGVADHVVKPFSPTEVAAQVSVALRRHADPQPFALDDLAIDYDRRRVSFAGQAVKLTPTEYELLRAFVKQLRARLGDDAAEPTRIFNIRGLCYRMPRPGKPLES